MENTVAAPGIGILSRHLVKPRTDANLGRRRLPQYYKSPRLPRPHCMTSSARTRRYYYICQFPRTLSHACAHAVDPYARHRPRPPRPGSDSDPRPGHALIPERRAASRPEGKIQGHVLSAQAGRHRVRELQSPKDQVRQRAAAVFGMHQERCVVLIRPPTRSLLVGQPRSLMHAPLSGVTNLFASGLTPRAS